MPKSRLTQLVVMLHIALGPSIACLALPLGSSSPFATLLQYPDVLVVNLLILAAPILFLGGIVWYRGGAAREMLGAWVGHATVLGCMALASAISVDGDIGFLWPAYPAFSLIAMLVGMAIQARLGK